MGKNLIVLGNEAHAAISELCAWHETDNHAARLRTLQDYIVELERIAAPELTSALATHFDETAQQIADAATALETTLSPRTLEDGEMLQDASNEVAVNPNTLTDADIERISEQMAGDVNVQPSDEDDQPLEFGTVEETPAAPRKPKGRG